MKYIVFNGLPTANGFCYDTRDGTLIQIIDDEIWDIVCEQQDKW